MNFLFAEVQDCQNVHSWGLSGSQKFTCEPKDQKGPANVIMKTSVNKADEKIKTNFNNVQNTKEKESFT